MTRSEAYDYFIAIVSAHDKDHPILSKRLEMTIGVAGTVIRDFVRDARRNKIAIAACPDGYYIAKSLSEYEDSIRDLEGRVRSMSVTLHAMKDTFVEEEQLELL